MPKTYFLLCFLFLNYFCSAQKQLFSSDNISSNWKIYKNREYQPYIATEGAKAIHFEMKKSRLKKEFLEIHSLHNFNLFINGCLTLKSTKEFLRLNLDSLRLKYSQNLSFTIYSPTPLNDKTISIIVFKPLIGKAESELGKRTNDGFLDFAILAFMILLMVFGILFRANPKLMFDYLNVAKIFSLRQREENLLSNRVASSTNILYYIFTSFLIAALLMVVIQQGNTSINAAQYFKFDSALKGFLNWMLLGLLITGLLFCKLIIIYSFSMLFKLRGTLQLHFFNFVRVLILISIIISIILLALFVGYQSLTLYKYVLFFIANLIFICWIIATYLKLLTNTSFRFFHLFSYLCATEIIPIIVLLKIIS